MANLTQTAADVSLAGTGATIKSVQVGEAVTQGMPGYQNGGDSKYYQCDGNDSLKDSAEGIFLTPAAADGYAVLQTAGPVDLGATLTIGETYVLSATKGAIAPIGDLVTGDYVTHLGVAAAAGQLDLDINVTGTQVP